MSTTADNPFFVDYSPAIAPTPDMSQPGMLSDDGYFTKGWEMAESLFGYWADHDIAKTEAKARAKADAQTQTQQSSESQPSESQQLQAGLKWAGIALAVIGVAVIASKKGAS